MPARARARASERDFISGVSSGCFLRGCLLKGGLIEDASSPAYASIDGDAARLEGRRPFLDLRRDEAREILRRAPLRRYHGDSESFIALAKCRRLHRFVCNFGKPVDDRLRRTLREGETD